MSSASRVGAVGGTAVMSMLLVVATAAPAAALYPDAGDDPGYQLTFLESLLLYVVAPIGLFAVIALLVAAPSIARGPRYRPGLGWWHGPVWFGEAGPGAGSAATSGPDREVDQTSLVGGGASARW